MHYFLYSLFVCLLIFPLSAVAAPVAYSTTVLADDPVGYWRLSETAGTTITDLSGNGHHGTYYNSPTLNQPGVTATGDRSVLLNGTDEYGLVADSPDFDFRDFTLEAWIKINGSATDHRRIISQQNTTDTEWYLLHLNDNRLCLYSSRDGIGNLSVGPTLNDGQWHHLVVTRDTIANAVVAYVDGTSVATIETYDDTTYMINRGLAIGSYYGTHQFFPGYLDEIAIYNTALTATSIQTHYQVGLGNVVVPEPACWILAGFFCLSLYWLRFLPIK